MISVWKIPVLESLLYIYCRNLLMSILWPKQERLGGLVWNRKNL